MKNPIDVFAVGASSRESSTGEEMSNVKKKITTTTETIVFHDLRAAEKRL